jgi:hypothetical protein
MKLSFKLATFLALTLCGAVFAQDYSYTEHLGKVVGLSNVVEYNTRTGVATYKEVTVSVRVHYRGEDHTIALDCPTDPPSQVLRTLCLDASTLLLYCPRQVVTSTCFPDPVTGICTLSRTEVCSSGKGMCVKTWGYSRVVAGQHRPMLDYLLTQSQANCSP